VLARSLTAKRNRIEKIRPLDNSAPVSSANIACYDGYDPFWADPDDDSVFFTANLDQELTIKSAATPNARFSNWKPSMATVIVRKRFWRQKWFLVLAVLAAISATMVVTLAILMHCIQLQEVPDIKEPFDLDKFGHVDVAPEDNAFELYRAASAKLVSQTNASRTDAVDAVLYGGWLKSSEELRDWLEENREALELFRQASERPEAVYFQPAEKTIVSPQLVVSNHLRTLAQLACLEAARLEANAKPAAAWTWLSALLRASRHSGSHGCTVERMVGITMHRYAYAAIVIWAANPRLAVADLRHVLADVRKIHARTVPASETLKVEYLITRKNYADLNLFSRDLDFPWYIANSFVMYPMGEPEMGRRLTKMIWTNWLLECDRPRHLRRPDAAGTARLYALDHDVASIEGGLSNARIESCLKRSVLGKHFLIPPQDFIIWHDCEAAKQRILEVALALLIYFHEHAGFPETLEQLVGHGLDEVPVDPFGTGESIRYRREPLAADGVTIWSIGSDGVDDDASFPSNKSRADDRGDILRQIWPPHFLGGPD